MASVRIEDEARRDPRFALLGKRMKTSRFDARGRMEELWAYCTENQTYYMSEEVIDVCAEFDGFAKLIESNEIGLAERKDNGLIRIKGTKGRIEWLKKIRNGAKSGGKSRIKTAQRSSSGRLVKNPAPVPAPGPGQSSALTLTLTPTLTPFKNNTNTICSEVKKSTIGAIEMLRGDVHTEKILEGVKQSVQEIWLKTYPDPAWMKSELLKAAAWIENNPKKAPKRLGPFMSNWFSRGWEQYRKTLPSNASAPPKSTSKYREDDPEFDELNRVRKELGLT